MTDEEILTKIEELTKLYLSLSKNILEYIEYQKNQDELIWKAIKTLSNPE